MAKKRKSDGDIYLILHGHFYQPPRDNPWLRVIETQESASPHHDWNARIHAECYRPNIRSRRMDGDGRIRDIVNNLEQISFNFGPTLLTWIEREDPEVYERILEADRKSAAARGGHGNAIAQAYHHVILPLAGREDRRLQIRWGLGDFERRFGRKSEGLWLPETAIHGGAAIDLARAGIRFLLLSPHQAGAFRPIGGEAWADVTDGSIDPRRPYRLFPDPEDPALSIDVFFYDGGLATGISFEHFLRNADDLGRRLRASAGAPDFGPRLVSVATDGEVYGHHEPFADMCLAALYGGVTEREGLTPTNPGEYLDLVPPVHEVALKPGPEGEGTAWSCAHGVGRWYRDCGCAMAPKPGWTQQWRTPFREAVDGLRSDLGAIFDVEGGRIFTEPAEALGRFVRARGEATEPSWRVFLEEQGRPDVGFDDGGAERAYLLLEMMYGAERMATSCGWFFDDVAGIEASQNLMFAGHAIDLARTLDPERASSAENRFRKKMRAARSNVPEEGDGQSVFDERTAGARATLDDWVAFAATARLLDVDVPERLLGGRRMEAEGEERWKGERFRALRGVIRVREFFYRSPEDRRFLAVLGVGPRVAVWVGDPEMDTSVVERASDMEDVEGMMPFAPRRLVDLPGELRRLLVDDLVEEEKRTFVDEEEAFFGWIGALATLIERAGLTGPPWFRRSVPLLLERRLRRAVAALLRPGPDGDREATLGEMKDTRRLAERFGVEVDASVIEEDVGGEALRRLRLRREGDPEASAASALEILRAVSDNGFPVLGLGELQDEFFDQLKSGIGTPLREQSRDLGLWLDFSPSILG
ncbi:MAG: DUF3536 domain-containing protein [Candidatus Eisenbacteria bacterium]